MIFMNYLTNYNKIQEFIAILRIFVGQTNKNLKKQYHGKMEVKKICLKSSQLTPDGPIYENIKEYELRGQ